MNRITCLATAAVLGAAGSALAQDWPQWMGENRDSAVSGFAAPDTWPEELTEVWSVEIGNGVATPALVGEHLFVFSRDDTHEIIRCLNAKTGEEIWSDRYEVEGADGAARGFAGPRSSPAVADGKVLSIGVRGTVSCLDASTGEVLWRNQEITRLYFQAAEKRFEENSTPRILLEPLFSSLEIKRK